MAPAAPSTPQLITLPEASRRYGLGLKTIRRGTREGWFPTYTAGTRWPRVRTDEFEAWIRSTRTVPGERARRHVERALGRRRTRS